MTIDQPEPEKSARGGGGRIRRAFLGPFGLRAGWSFLLFVGLLLLLQVAIGPLWRALDPPPDVPWDPLWMALDEAVSLAAALVVIAVLARVERRSLAEYGLRLRRLVGLPFWEGTVWGLATVGGVIGLQWLVGSYSVKAIVLGGGELATLAVFWGLAFLMVALAEETLFRSYPLYTLGRGLGFWPAALLLAGVFGALHYFLKPGESWIDGLSTGLLGLFLCLTVRRTGDVGLAAGYHAAFNFAALFLFGGSNTGNGGQPLEGRLLDAAFTGPEWLTGGAMGPEASVFVFLVLAVVAVLFHRRHPEARFDPAGRTGSSSG